MQGGPHERRLINDLMDRYQNLERPVFNESEPLNLKFGLTLQQIIDVVSTFTNNKNSSWSYEKIFHRILLSKYEKHQKTSIEYFCGRNT